MLYFAAIAWPSHKIKAAAGTTIWLIATVYSFTAALGFAALNRDAAAATRKSQADIYATLETMRQSPRWQSSAACADATAKASVDFCTTYRATESRLTSAPSRDDPQAHLISSLTGISQHAAHLMLAIALAIACEIVSALGLFAIAASPTPPRITAVQTSPDKPIANIKPVPPHLAPPKWRPHR